MRIRSASRTCGRERRRRRVSSLPPGGLGIFTPTITENTGDADPSGQLSWTFTVDNAALATLNFGDHIQQVYTVQINDGHGGLRRRTSR